MKRFILAFSMFSVWLAIASTYYMCVIKGQCDGNETVETIPTTTSKPNIKKTIVLDTITSLVSTVKKVDSLVAVENTINTNDTLKISGLKIYDKQSLLKKYYSNFKIYKNKSRVRIPIGISEYGYVVAKHMDSVNSALTVKGFYNQEETPEQGQQRATFIKERLTKLGIPSRLITTTSVLRIFDYNNNTFIGGIQFDFKKTDSVIRLNKVDYTLFKNSQNEIVSDLDKDTIIEKMAALATKEEIKITDIDMEAITKKKPTIVPSAEVKKATKPVVKKEKASFTVTERDFKNQKFKASKSLKKFLETHKTAKSIKLMGYSNAGKNTGDTYNKGLELANLVKDYISEKGLYNGKTSINALKKQPLVANDTIREGVTLIVQ